MRVFTIVLLAISFHKVNSIGNGRGPANPKPRPPAGGVSTLRPPGQDGLIPGVLFRSQPRPLTFVISGSVTALDLPDGAELLLPSIRSGFSCLGRIYGYYADTDNGCRIFHVCNPTEDGRGLPQKFSFFCGNQTIFNQKILVCDHEDKVICSEASSYYAVNEKFGKI